MNTLRRIFTGTALLVAACGIASADSISFVTSNPRVSSPTELSGNLLFTQFDLAWGTLNSVTLNFSGSFTTTVTVTNNSQSASTGTAKTELQLSVQDGLSSFTVLPQIDANSPVFSYSLAGGNSVTSSLLTKSGLSFSEGSAALTGTALANFLAEFTGTGNTALSLSTFTQTLVGNTGGNTGAG